MVNFRRLYSPEKQKLIAQVDEFYNKRFIEFRNMKTENLLATVKYYMSQMKDPYKYEPNAPVYDAVFWHLIIPEMMRRLSGRFHTSL